MVAGIVLALWLLTYLALRVAWRETWVQDGQDYVIFPEGAVWTYRLFRPLSYGDAVLTGMGTHIGPHR